MINTSKIAKITITNFVTNWQKYGRIRNSNKCSNVTDFVTVMTDSVIEFRTYVLICAIYDFHNFCVEISHSLPFPSVLPKGYSLPIGASLPKGSIIGVS